MSNSSETGVIMAGGVIVMGVVAVTAVVSIVGAIVAAFMAMLSTILMVLGVVAGVAVLAFAAPGIIRAVGDAKAAQLRTVYTDAVQQLEAGYAAGGRSQDPELEALRQRLQLLELRSAPVRKLEG